MEFGQRNDMPPSSAPINTTPMYQHPTSSGLNFLMQNPTSFTGNPVGNLWPNQSPGFNTPRPNQPQSGNWNPMNAQWNPSKPFGQNFGRM